MDKAVYNGYGSKQHIIPMNHKNRLFRWMTLTCLPTDRRIATNALRPHFSHTLTTKVIEKANNAAIDDTKYSSLIYNGILTLQIRIPDVGEPAYSGYADAT